MHEDTLWVCLTYIGVKQQTEKGIYFFEPKCSNSGTCTLNWTTRFLELDNMTFNYTKMTAHTGGPGPAPPARAGQRAGVERGGGGIHEKSYKIKVSKKKHNFL